MDAFNLLNRANYTGVVVVSDPTANEGSTRLEAVTKDQLNTGFTGQTRYRVSERNLYAFLFRHQEAVRPRDGLLRLRAPPEDRQLPG